MTSHYGVAVRGGAGGIVAVTLEYGLRTVTDAWSLPYDVSAVTRRIEAIRAADPAAAITIDRDQLGGAVWRTLGLSEKGRERSYWRRYEGTGPARFTDLIEPLLAAGARGEFVVAKGIAGAPALRRALEDAHRDVARGDEVGGALVVALALALKSKPPVPPRVY